MRFSIVLAAPLIAAVTFIGQPASPKDSDGIAAAVADPARPEADRQRDANRKPAECLAFAGVKPGDRVAELMPGGGYFTRLFSKTVGAGGMSTRWCRRRRPTRRRTCRTSLRA